MLFLLLFTLVSNTPIHGASINITTSRILDFPTVIERYREDGHYSFADGMEQILVNNQVAFCIEPSIAVGDGTGYSMSDFTSSQHELFNKIIFHGYDNTAKTAQDYTLAQHALWLNVPGTSIPKVDLVLPNFQAQYQALMSKVKAHDVKASFDGQTINLKVGESITLTDTNGVLAQSQLMDSAGLQVVKNGNSVTITALNSSAEKNRLTFKKYPTITSETQVTPILYSHPTDQDIITGGNPKPVYFNVLVNVEQKGILQINKQGELGEFIPNTTFQISTASDMSNPITITTDEQGLAKVTDLNAGTYYVKEIKVDSPYILNNEIKTVEILPQQTTTLDVVNQQAQGQFSLTKVDSELPDLLLAGATFEVKNEAGEIVATMATDENGKATSPLLPLGVYSVQEINAPVGYLLDETEYTVELKYQDMNTAVVNTHLELTNEVIKGQIHIVKVDSQNEESPIENAEFEIRNQLGEVVEVIKTNKDGFAYSSALRYGEYVIKEIAAPSQYYLNSAEYPISIDQPNQIQVQYIKNEQVQLKLQLEKVDGLTKEPLAGAVFEVINLENGEPVTFEYLNDQFEKVTQSQLITNENGIAVTRGNLAYGTYEIREVKAPRGYVRMEPIQFEVNRDTEFVNLEVLGSTTIKKITNAPTRHQFLKTDFDGQPLEGASLRLLNENNEVIVEWTSSLQPFEIKGLEVGKQYVLEEVGAPEGYLLSDPITFTVAETEDVIEIKIVNELRPELHTTALFETGIKESFAEKELIVIDKIAYDKVIVGKEYLVKGKLVDVQTQEVLCEAETTFIPDTSQGTIEVIFEFDGTNYAGKQLVVIEELFKNDILITSHSDLNDKNQTVSIKKPTVKTSAQSKARKAENPKLITIEDTVYYTDLIIGQTYTIQGLLMNKETGLPYKVNNKVVRAEKVFVAEAESGQETLEFSFMADNLTELSVVVFEELVYQDTIITSHKDINDENQTIHFVEVKIVKKDKQLDKGLPYAEFKLYQYNNELDHLITDRNGEAHFVVEEGEWILKEVKAPEGYQLSLNTIPIQVKQGQDNDIVIYNEPIPKVELPTTGEDSSTWYLLSGLTILSMGAVLLVKSKRRKSKE